MQNWRIGALSFTPRVVEQRRAQGPWVVTIDGPAGAGKSSVALALAKRLKVPMLDTGAIYRALAFWSAERGVAWEDEAGLAKLLEQFDLRFVSDTAHPRGARVFLGQLEVTDAIRSQGIGVGASIVSAHPQVRGALLGLQRTLAKGGCVAEGRDMGSVVLPDADHKFFLTASAKARAKRRYAELSAGPADPSSDPAPLSLDEVEAEIVARDQRDEQREVSPLQQAPDAVRIDSSELSAMQVVDLMWDIMHGKTAHGR